MTDDLINRQAVLEIFGDIHPLDYNAQAYANRIKALPSVTPTERTGHWIKVTNGRGGRECDICHEYAPSYQDGDEYLTKYCPKCGCRMFEPQESEEISDTNLKMWEEIFKAESEVKE